MWVKGSKYQSYIRILVPLIDIFLYCLTYDRITNTKTVTDIVIWNPAGVYMGQIHSSLVIGLVRNIKAFDDG